MGIGLEVQEEHATSDGTIQALTINQTKTHARQQLTEIEKRCMQQKTMPHLVPPAAGPSAELKSEKYENLLRLNEDSLPEPNTLTDWISEVISLPQWLSTMAFDIGEYLRSIDNVDLRQRPMSDYKDGKGYSYFASGWVKEVEFHPISEDSKFRFLCMECLPSQRIRNVPRKVWVAIVKSSGAVKSAYCTCFAG